MIKGHLGLPGPLTLPTGTLLHASIPKGVELNLQARQIIAEFYEPDYARWRRYIAFA